MGNSFQDQLFKAGLVNKQQLNESKHSKHKQRKQHQGKKAKNSTQQNTAQSEQQQQRARDRELNRQQQASREQKALHAEVRQLIELNRIVYEDGEIAYKFSDQGKVKQLYVSTTVQNDLAADRLQIVRHDDSYAILPSSVVSKILQRYPKLIVIKNDDASLDDERYADYKVPDDLIW